MPIHQEHQANVLNDLPESGLEISERRPCRLDGDLYSGEASDTKDVAVMLVSAGVEVEQSAALKLLNYAGVHFKELGSIDVRRT